MVEVRTTIRDTELIIETGRIAKQASGSVLISFGGSLVLSTVCMSEEPVDQDFFPLSVHYGEKYYAAGKIPGGFIKRESKPKDKEVLTSRIIDRPMRPLFPKGIRNDIQILPTTLSVDQENPPDILAMIAASACVCISEIPFNGPVGAVRVAYIDGKMVVFPTFQELETSQLNLVIAGTKHAITMIEGSALEIPENILVQAVQFAEPYIKQIVELQEELIQKAGKPKVQIQTFLPSEEFKQTVKETGYENLKNALKTEGKKNREDAVKQVYKSLKESLTERFDEETVKGHLKEIFEEMEYDIVRDMILNNNIRVDGRRPDEIRNIQTEIAVLPRTHGSALFTRGETQALAVTTLGTSMDEQRFDDLEGEGKSHFILHYNFPPFSVGETGRVGPPGRREIGHGNLAFRSLEAVLPDHESFPYTVRIVSEIMESNGSSSMATVCASSLAMLDAGMPIKTSVAGLAMGMVSDSKSGKYAILSDIQGVEDHQGDMDLKVAGTVNGITAFQMDVKVEGISNELLQEALEHAKKGRLHILDIMNKCLSLPREHMSAYAPKIVSMNVEVEKIKDIIGPGGSIIKGITERTGAQIKVHDDGKVLISSKDESNVLEAYNYIKSIVQEVKVGKTYNGIIKRMMDIGLFIEVLPGKEGLFNLSRLPRDVSNQIRKEAEIGKEVVVIVTEIDRQGRINLAYPDFAEPPARRSSGRRYSND